MRSEHVVTDRDSFEAWWVRTVPGPKNCAVWHESDKYVVLLAYERATPARKVFVGETIVVENGEVLRHAH